MINISQTKYHVKYEDGNIKEIECEPTQIKKVISKSLNMAFENIILINAHNNRMYSASNSFIQFKNTSIDLNVMDINQVLRENLNSKKKVIELQNNVDDLQKEFVQLKEANREIINQLSQCKDNDQLIKKQRDQNFQELQRIEKQYKEKLMTQQQLYEQKITQINQNKEELLSENEDLQRKIQELNNMVSKQERDFVNEKYFLQQQGDNQLNFNHQIYESQIAKLEQEKQVMQNQIKQKNNLISQLESDIQEKGIFQQAQIQDLEDQQNRQEYYYKQNIQVLKQRINDINSSIDLSDNNNQNVIIKNYCNEAIREIDQIKKEMIDEEKNRNLEVQQKLKQQNNELQQKVEKLQKLIKTYTSQLKNAETDQHYQQQKFSNEIEQLNSQLKKVKKDLDSKQDEMRQLMLIKDQLQSENNELNKYNEKYERNIQQLSQTKAKQQSNIEELEEKYRLQHNQLLLSEQTVISQNGEINLLKSYIEKQNLLINKMKQKIGRLTEMLKLISNKNLGKGLEQVNSPVAQLINSRFGIQKFQENPNFQGDETDYLIYRIKPSNNFLQSIKRGQFINLKQFLDIEHIGEIKTLRSMQPNEEGDLMKVYIIKVQDTQIKELKNRILIRKDLSKGQNYDTKENAAAISLNNIFTQVFMDQFVKDLTELSMKTLNFSIAPQYVIQSKGKEEYYYCEEIIQQNVKQINGGEQNLGSSQEEQFLNSFSKYSHILSQQEIVITYINTVKQYLYDMIVTTEFGCFSEIDQGKDEFIRAIDAIESAEAINFGEFYNQQLELKAQEFIQ